MHCNIKGQYNLTPIHMKTLVINALNEDALKELNEMQISKKITILEEQEWESAKARKQNMLDEINNYTYESIRKNIKGTK